MSQGRVCCWVKRPECCYQELRSRIFCCRSFHVPYMLMTCRHKGLYDGFERGLDIFDSTFCCHSAASLHKTRQVEFGDAP